MIVNRGCLLFVRAYPPNLGNKKVWFVTTIAIGAMTECVLKVEKNNNYNNQKVKIDRRQI